MTGADDDDEHVEIHVEKEEEDEEIQARNEVSFAVNDYCSEFNRNKQITLKSKEIDVPELIKIALDALKEKFYTPKEDPKKAPGTG